MKATVIGAGPNGLAAAVALAQAGCSVRLREARAQIGGGASSAALTLPGFVHDPCSAIHPLGVGSPFFRTLPLERHGLEWIHPPVALAHPLPDGTAAAAYRSLEETAAGFGRDGAAYKRLFGPLVANWDALAEEFLQPILHLPRTWRVIPFGLLAMQPARLLARRTFRDEPARALFAGIAAHSFLSLESPFSAAIGLVLGAALHTVGWPFPRGGSQGISDALAGHLRELGGTVETESPLRSYDEDEGPLLLDLSAWNAARIPGERLPAAVRARLRGVRHAAAVFKIDYALNAPIPWRAEVCRRAATVHVGGTLDEIAAGERAVVQGRIPDWPFILLAQQSLFDPTRAPVGCHTAWAYCHVPLGCTENMTERMEAQIERFAPGFRDCILDRHTMGPQQIEAMNDNLIGGDITGGASDIFSLLARPSFSPNPYRLAKGLYLCSSSTPPGGGAHGMCGWHAAQAALRDDLPIR